jgi:mannosyl-3-phosphoglycerate phosphatase
MTRAEIELIQQALGLRQPFIVESGAAALIPRGYFGHDLPDVSDGGKYVRLEIARPHAHTVQTLRNVAARFGVEIVGFSDLSAADVGRECGFCLSRARAAKMREYSEPVTTTLPGRCR